MAPRELRRPGWVNRGRLVERNYLSPYGQLTVFQETGFGDRDGDQDVDAPDKGTPGTTCTTLTGKCRVLDLDFDGDYDSADATLFDALPQGYMATPGLLASATDQPFAHQGLLYEPEIGTYQNRARQYDPEKRRFVQRDPLRFIDGLNIYYATRNNPVRFPDPRGTKVKDPGGILSRLVPCCAFASDEDGFAQICSCACEGHYSRTRRKIEEIINDSRTLVIHFSATHYTIVGRKLPLNDAHAITIPPDGSNACNVDPSECSPDSDWHIYIQDGSDRNHENIAGAHEIFGHFQPPPDGDWRHDNDPGYPGGPGDFAPGDAYDDEQDWSDEACAAGDGPCVGIPR